METYGGGVENVYTARRRLVDQQTKTRRETGDGIACNDVYYYIS